MNAAKKRVDGGKASHAAERIRDLLFALAGTGAPARAELLELPHQLFTGVAGALALTRDARVQKQQRPVRAALLVVHEFVGGRREDGRPATSSRTIERNAAAWERFIRTVFGDGAMRDACGIYGPFELPGNRHIPAGIPLYLGKVTQQVDRIS